MNRVLWLQRWREERRSDVDRTVPSRYKMQSPENEGQANIFIALPKRQVGAWASPPKVILSHTVLVQFPLGYDPLRKRTVRDNRTLRRRYGLAPTLVSVFSLTASVFAAIGLLQLMISSFGFSDYREGYLRPGLAAHKPGPGPAPEDAVTNEYQHALTREMIAAGDTTGKTQEVTEKDFDGSAILPQIRVSADRFNTRVKGQIKDLKLKVFNGSKTLLEKVTIQVDFLSSGGHLIRSENYTTDSLAPLQLKVIDVPQGMPGDQIRYYIAEVRSKTLRTTLRGL